jgi:TRAP-type C4-dicarboxylate transport system substrate-binding protein
MVNATGALLMNKRTFYRLSPKNRDIVRRLAKSHAHRLVQLTRRDNAEAVQVLADAGIERVLPSQELIASFEQSAQKNYQMSISSLYSKALFDQITGLIAHYRTAKDANRQPADSN